MYRAGSYPHLQASKAGSVMRRIGVVVEGGEAEEIRPCGLKARDG